MTTKEIANTIVANCRSGKMFDNYELFSENVVSREAQDSQFGKEVIGIKPTLEKAKYFHNLIEKRISREVSDPLVAGNYFTFRLCQEFELKEIGYYKLDELCLFEVKDGKVICEEYFYNN
jgi:hypothetical protein